MFPVTHSPVDRHPRAGYLYLGVMMTALIVGLVGVSALSVARVKFDTAQRQNDLFTAQTLARTAIEDAVRQINDDASWRTNLSINIEYPDPAHNLGAGSFTWKLSDDDGNLSDDDADAAWLTGIGRVGDAVFVETVMLQPTGAGLSCLEAAFHCGTSVTLGSAADIETDQFFSSNGSINASALLSKIDGNAEAVGTITGAVTGTTTEGITPRRMPSETVFDYYLRNGTWIDYDSLENGGGGKRIRQTVLSPNLNPFGSAVNAEGIYVIDCQNQQLTIENTRILGTLVLVNSSASTFIDFSQYWSPAVLNYPTLLVDGSISFRYLSGDLDENDQGSNYNPVGAPYEGSEDSDTNDTYPSKIKGLVYVSGTLKLPTLTPDSLVDGCVICGTLDARSDATFDYRATFLNYPPPGFASGNPMQIAPGTWHRTTGP
ncbi:MAG: hypothetical protein KDA86_07650 [Planctomycetaceae bacterium]|nr:hypothetical protein [Planctomycetaceae bacterium]